MPAATSTVLVVDDTAEVRAFFRRILERDGYRVVDAATGESGLTAVTSHVPDLVVLDLMLPGLDGVGVARAIRAHEDPRIRAVPMLACSASLDRERLTAALSAGCDAFEPKPINVQRFLDAIRALLAERMAD